MSRPMSARMRPAPASASVSAVRRPPHTAELNEEDEEDFGVVDDDQDEEDDEIDLDAYEAYLDDIKRKAAARPHSARIMRPYPTESPQFYMVNPTNPVNPIDHSSITAQPQASRGATRPGARPMSARPRLNSGEETLQPTAPHAPQTARPSSASAGVRRRRQGSGTGSNNGNDGLNARIRAVYNDVGRTPLSSGSASKLNATVLSTSHTATSVMQSRLKVFQDTELQHEHHRLVDVVSDLRSVVQHEQDQRLKAMARVRRLEEIVTMKDKKIESLLHAQGSASVSVSCHGSDSMSLGALAQREMAQKERLHHAVMQKLRHKLAQQSQILASYEEAMQALRANTKSTSLMEMEEEKQQLCIEVARLHGVISALQAELEHQSRQLVELMGGDAQYQAQLGKMQQELKRSAHEKHKLEQETLFLKATVHQLEHKLALEQKKRVYDQSLASGGRISAGNRSPTSSAKSSPRVLSPTSSVRSPTSTAYLAEALAEMKTLKAAPVSLVPSSPVKTRRPTPLPTKSQLELCEAEEEEDRRLVSEEGIRSPLPTTDVGERTSCPEVSTSALAGVLKSPVASEQSEVAKKRVRWQTSEDEEQEGKASRWRLRVHAEGAQRIKAASGLVTFDAKPDPYVTFVFGGVTKHCEHVQDVEPLQYFTWPNAVVEFDVKEESELLQAALVVHVKDKDTLKDRYIGGTSIPLAPLYATKSKDVLCQSKFFVLDYSDEKLKSKKDSGEVKLTITVVDTMAKAEPPQFDVAQKAHREEGSVDQARGECRTEHTEEEDGNEELERDRVEPEQVVTTQQGSEETYESRIDNDSRLDSRGKQDEDEDAQEDAHATVGSLAGECEATQSISSAVVEEDDESTTPPNAALEEADQASDASLSRTNSSDSSRSSVMSLSRSSHSSSSSSLSRSASGASTSSASSSSLSSLLAQEDAAAMALEEAAALKAAAEQATPQDMDPEELQYASDFSDDAEGSIN